MKKKINLLYIIYSMNNGGAETLALRLAEIIDKDHFNTTVCSLSDKGPLRKILEDKKIPFVTLGKKEGKDLSIVLRLRKLLKDKRIDMIHTHNQGPLLYTFLATFFTKKYKIVHTEHINMLKELSYSKKHFYYNKILYGKVDGFISIAKHLTDDFKKQYNLSRVRVATIHNCVDTANVPASPSKLLKSELELNDKAQIIGNISALRLQKDHDTLIRAMKIVAEKVPDAILVVAGDGDQKEALLALISELGIANNVKLLGYRSDVGELLGQFDIFVLSSLYEGLPLCILEAMAAGKPIVATDADGTNELIIDDVTGLLAPTKNPEKLAQAMITLLESPDKAKQLGSTAQKLVQEKYSIKTMMQKYEQFYKELL